MSAKAENNVEAGKDVVAPVSQPPPAAAWVRFEEEAQNGKHTDAAVITTESIQVNLERSISSLNENSTPIPDPKPLRNIQLPTATVEPIRQGFCKCLSMDGWFVVLTHVEGFLQRMVMLLLLYYLLIRDFHGLHLHNSVRSLYLRNLWHKV